MLQFPKTFGGWKTISESELDETSLKILQPSASLLRTVQREEGNGVPIIMTLLVGPPGNIGAHTPEVCVSGSGYEQLGAKEAVEVKLATGPDVTHRFWKATFRSRGIDRHILLEYWGWSTGEAWQAPELPAFLAVNTQFGRGKNPHMPGIVKAQQAVAAADPRAVYVDTSAAPVVNAAHFSSEGTLQVGEWFAEAFMKLEAADASAEKK